LQAALIAILLLLFTPLIVHEGSTFQRFLAACFAVLLACKIYDFADSIPESGGEPVLYASYLLFLVHPCTIIYAQSRKRLVTGTPKTHDWLRLAVSLPLFASGCGVFYVLVSTRFAHQWFILDHFIKVMTLLFIIESSSQWVYSLCRLLNLDVQPVIRYGFLAKTPAEFWQRYNTLVGSWLHKHVFIPAGGRHRYSTATVVTFVTSGLIHEYIFNISARGVTGYMMVFFLVQALAVSLTAQWNRKLRKTSAVKTITACVLTMVFVILSSIMFFCAFSRILPGFYSAACWFNGP